jgi:hypothetical protein
VKVVGEGASASSHCQAGGSCGVFPTRNPQAIRAGRVLSHFERPLRLSGGTDALALGPLEGARGPRFDDLTFKDSQLAGSWVQLWAPRGWCCPLARVEGRGGASKD